METSNIFSTIKASKEQGNKVGAGQMIIMGGGWSSKRTQSSIVVELGKKRRLMTKGEEEVQLLKLCLI